MIKGPGWPDARGWIGIGTFALAVMLLWMMRDDELRGDEFFQTIATVIISNGLMAVVAWAYAATKGGGEQATKVGELAAKATEALATSAPASEAPQQVEVVNTPEKPAIVSEAGPVPAEELPEYAR